MNESTNVVALENVREIWRPVVGYEEFYEVSNLGRVKSLPRFVLRKTGNYISKTRIRKPGVGINNPYPTLSLTKDFIDTMHYVHHLVLAAFIGPRPEGCEACHGDGNTTNNSESNLRWGTRKDNHADKRLHGTHLAGDRHPGAKLTVIDVRVIRKLHAVGVCVQTVLNYFKISRSNHWRIVTRQLWTNVS